MQTGQKGTEGYKEFHQKLEKIIEENWGIIPQFSDPFSWGYSSTGIYIKDIYQEEYVAILAENTPEKKRALEKDILITSSLKLSVDTPQQLRTKSGEYLLEIDKIEVTQGKSVTKRIMHLRKFMPGILPFDMNMDILMQAIKILHEIHQVDPASIDFSLETIECENPKFLHGDLTPSNMLIAYGKVIAVLDFELALLGPAEYDLARLAVFSWFRMENTPFSKVLEEVKKTYPENVSIELLKNFSILHCQMHLTNIKKHRKVYEDQQTYKADLTFTEKKLETLKADLAQIPNLI